MLKNKNKNNNSTVYLPEELMIEILSKLAVRDLLQFKSVCKSWLFLINSPSFIRQHLEVSKKNNQCFLLYYRDRVGDDYLFSIVSNQTLGVLETQPLPYHSKYIVGSCNGIVCLAIPPQNNENMLIWNPATRQTKKFNVPNCLRTDDHKWFSKNLGFGFDAKNNDYKVIIITSFTSVTGHPCSRFQVNVYSVKTGSWTLCSCCSKYDNLFMHNVTHWGVYSDTGMYSWVVMTIKPDTIEYLDHLEELEEDEDVEEVMIMSFDMTNEVLISTPLPCNGITDNIVVQRWSHPTLVKGSMAVVYNITGIETNVWVLGEYGVKESWSKLFSLAHIGYEKTYGFLNNYDKLFLVVKMKTEELFLFDPTSQERNSLPVLKNGTILWQLVANFTASLVPVS